MKRNENCYGCHELPIKVVHKGVYKSTKLCLTCYIARPFRSNHCSDCDNCTLRFDHHCPWIGGCVGKRNYIYFFVFLILLNIKNFYLLIFSIIHIFKVYLNVSEEDKKKNSWVAKKLITVIPSLFTIILIAATMTFTTGLIIYHIKLIISNVTTKEEIKKLIPIKIGNSYDRGMAKNCNEFWTRHKSMKNNYTLKDLRLKGKPEKKTPLVSTKKFRPKIMPFSEKQKFLKNKAKKEKNDTKSIEERFYSQNSDKNSKNDGTDDENTKSINSDNNSNSSNMNENNSNNNKNITKTKNNITKRNKKNEKKNSKTENKKIFKNSSSSSKKSSNKESSNYSEYNKRNEVEDFSDVDISDENDISNRKICNTSIKNSNLNNNIINKMNKLSSNRIRIKTYMNEKKIDFNSDDDNDLNNKMAQQRLEELSSEITIHEEINQLGSSLSIPRENSCNSSLSQNA